MERSYRETEVQRLIAQAVAPLVARIAAQDQQIAALKAENTQLREEAARLKKNSSNSSKPHPVISSSRRRLRRRAKSGPLAGCNTPPKLGALLR